MLFLTRWFGVTASDADRNLDREKAEIEEITELSLLLQEKSAAKQNRPLGRGTHVKGVSVRGQFEVLDVTAGRDYGLGMRLAKGVFAKPGVYPAIVRFANSDPSNNSDFKPDVRSMSFSVDLTREGEQLSTGLPVGRISHCKTLRLCLSMTRARSWQWSRFFRRQTRSLPFGTYLSRTS